MSRSPYPTDCEDADSVLHWFHGLVQLAEAQGRGEATTDAECAERMNLACEFLMQAVAGLRGLATTQYIAAGFPRDHPDHFSTDHRHALVDTVWLTMGLADLMHYAVRSLEEHLPMPPAGTGADGGGEK